MKRYLIVAGSVALAIAAGVAFLPSVSDAAARNGGGGGGGHSGGFHGGGRGGGFHGGARVGGFHGGGIRQGGGGYGGGGYGVGLGIAGLATGALVGSYPYYGNCSGYPARYDQYGRLINQC